MSVCMIYIIIIIWVCIIYMHILYKLFLKYKIQPTQTCLHVFRKDYLILNNQLVWSFHFQRSVVFRRYLPMVDWGPMRFHSFSLLTFLLLSCLFRYFFYAAMVMRLDDTGSQTFPGDTILHQSFCSSGSTLSSFGIAEHRCRSCVIDVLLRLGSTQSIIIHILIRPHSNLKASPFSSSFHVTRSCFQDREATKSPNQPWYLWTTMTGKTMYL